MPSIAMERDRIHALLAVQAQRAVVMPHARIVEYRYTAPARKIAASHIQTAESMQEQNNNTFATLHTSFLEA